MLLNLNMNQKNQTQINFHKYQFFNLFFFARPKHSNQSHTTQLNNSNWTQLRKKKRSQIQSEKKNNPCRQCAWWIDDQIQREKKVSNFEIERNGRRKAQSKPKSKSKSLKSAMVILRTYIELTRWYTTRYRLSTPTKSWPLMRGSSLRDARETLASSKEDVGFVCGLEGKGKQDMVGWFRWDLIGFGFGEL